MQPITASKLVEIPYQFLLIVLTFVLQAISLVTKTLLDILRLLVFGVLTPIGNASAKLLAHTEGAQRAYETNTR